MTAAGRFHVGQTVILSDFRGSREVVIKRVGRKYAYIERFGREAGFSLATGGAIEGGASIYTVADFNERSERAGVVDALHKVGLWDYGRARGMWFTTDQLRRILAIAQEAQR